MKLIILNYASPPEPFLCGPDLGSHFVSLRDFLKGSNLVNKFFANSRKNDFRAKPEVTGSLFGKRRQPSQADLCESPFRQVQLAALGFELGDLVFELGEFDVWISASPHLVKSTSQSGESEDNDILVGLIGHSMLMQKGPTITDHAASKPTMSRTRNSNSASLTSGFSESPFC